MRSKIEPPVILVAEDDDDLRDFLCSLLALEGYEVVPASNGAEAIEYIDNALLDSCSPALPSVIVTDVRMPGQNGFDVMAYAKFVPTIVVTAFGDAQTHRTARALGSRHVFDKPCDPDALRTAVRTLINRPAHN